MVEYSSRYCAIDTRVLCDGYNQFRKNVIDALDIDIKLHYSVASIADKFLRNEGCYIGVHELSGHVRDFIASAYVGGRVMTLENKIQHLTNCKIADFDAVSYYASATSESPTTTVGSLRGLPKSGTRGSTCQRCTTTSYAFESTESAATRRCQSRGRWSMDAGSG